jgi:sugar phosphate isomerase/epimerase
MPMQLGFSAWAMDRMPVPEQIALVRDAGYATIELVNGPRGSLDAEQTDAATRHRIRGLLAESGLDLVSIASHGNLLEADAQRRAAQLARIQAGIDLAVDLAGPAGPPCVVTMAYGKPDEYESIRETVAQNFGELARYGGQRGVTVALEPHVGQAFDLPEKVAWLVETVGSPHFRLNLDNSHFEVMGRDMADYIPVLVPVSVHTHLKDQRGRSPAHDFLVPGEGEFDYARYFAAMAAAGYGRSVTVEISKQAQRDPAYDPAAVAARSFQVLTAAADRAGVPLARGARPRRAALEADGRG